MIILGIILLVIGYVLAIHILWILGIILLIIGVALFIAGRLGHPVGGRGHYW